MTKAAAYRTAIRFEAGGWRDVARTIPEEAPVTIAPNGAAFAAVMATPADLEDLALGFAVTERIVARPELVEEITVAAVDEGFEARIRVPEADARRLAEKRRAFAARTSCSMCGLEDLDELLATRPMPSRRGPTASPDALAAAMAALPDAQRLNSESRGVHAAGWLKPSVGLVTVREDVGRHNALDKLIGALARDGADFAEGAICLTSRCSIEMVLKATAVGVGMIAAASSPTELAVRAAEAADVVLVAGAKGGAFDVYAGGDRLRSAA